MSGDGSSSFLNRFIFRKRVPEDDGSACSLFDRPTPAMVKMRKDAQTQREKGHPPSITTAGMKSPQSATEKPKDHEPSVQFNVYEDWVMLYVSTV